MKISYELNKCVCKSSVESNWLVDCCYSVQKHVSSMPFSSGNYSFVLTNPNPQLFWTKNCSYFKNRIELKKTFCNLHTPTYNNIRCKKSIAFLTWVRLLTRERFTVLEVAASWRDLMTPQHTLWPFIAHVSEQLDPWLGSQQTYHRPNQPH